MSATLVGIESRRPVRAVTRRIGVVAPVAALTGELTMSDDVRWHVTPSDGVSPDSWRDLLESAPVATLVYVPRIEGGPDLRPDLAHARAAFLACRRAGTTRAVVVSSTAVYGATPRHAGLATERRASLSDSEQAIARQWLELESLAASVFAGCDVTVLRAAPVPIRGERDYYSKLLGSKLAFPVAGHDPTLQLLSVRDLARAIQLAIRHGRPGVFNIVPAAPVPLRAALRAAGCWRIPLPWTVHRVCRAVAGGRLGVASAHQIRFVRYHLTAAPDRATGELGFVARDTSLEAVRLVRQRGSAERPLAGGDREDRFDPFGLDRAYIDRCNRGWLGFLHRRYWRVETRGLEHLPQEGGAVLVGMHRGFMPFDGVMTLLTVVERTGRVPRFLIHPGVGLRFPFLFNLMSKLGGVIACQDNGDRVLAAGELLGVYPEGIRGAFTMYRRAQRIGPSWRNDCVAFALRHRVPLVPFVTVGSAEIFPILGRIKSRWWRRYTEWPFIPITPTFPLIPVPLPSKWHTVFLPPLHVEREHPADAADNPAIVRAIGDEVKRRMEATVENLVHRRRSIFFGSIFGSDAQA